MSIDYWRFLVIDGEFAPREHILSGLSLEQVGRRLDGAAHTIYGELWHVTRRQNFVLERIQAKVQGQPWTAAARDVEKFPANEVPASQSAWDELMKEFLDGLERAVNLAHDPEALAVKVAAGLDVRQSLDLLAVHNAYHLGKIVLLQQLMGAWTPPVRA